MILPSKDHKPTTLQVVCTRHKEEFDVVVFVRMSDRWTWMDEGTVRVEPKGLAPVQQVKNRFRCLTCGDNLQVSAAGWPRLSTALDAIAEHGVEVISLNALRSAYTLVP